MNSYSCIVLPVSQNVACGSLCKVFSFQRFILFRHCVRRERLTLIFKCPHSKFDRCERSFGRIQRRLILVVVLIACLSDKRGMWVICLKDLGCLGWIYRWISGGLEAHSDSKEFHPSFKNYISLLILLLI